MNPQHDEFLDELAAVVDGDPQALERWADTLADSEAARDARHEAQHAADALKQAGADYVPPADLADRVLAALDARPDAAPQPAPEPAATPAPAPEPQRTQAPTADAPPPEKKSGNVAKVLVFGGVATLLAAAAAVGLFVAMNQGDDAEDPLAIPAGNLSAHLDLVVRSAGGEGVQVAPPGGDAVASTEGAEVQAGSRVVTDPRSRARLTLSDGSTLVLNQDTELVVGEDERSVELVRGEILAEVAHLDEGPRAEYQTPAGLVEVVGTKFFLTASDDRASVRVTQGVVRVHAQGQSAEVKTGQEGLMQRGQAPQVLPAVGLATSMGWSELGETAEDDLPVPGLGELRAHRPGEREEEERELHLAHHGVQVRIVGNVARTEIHETFRNDTDDELEGVYRFPLPPGARIASLSLKVDGEWEEGAFVDKERGQQIWRGVIRNATPEQQRNQQEEFIWVPGPWRDPALLEWQQGGRFELRIFPIPANGEREVRLSYEQTIAPHADGRRYVYPLAHAEDDSTRVGHFEVDVRVAGDDTEVKSHGYAMNHEPEDGAQRMRYTRDDFRPSGDLVIDYRAPADDAEARWWTFTGQATVAPPERSREDRDVREAQQEVHEDDRGYVLFALRPELPGWTEAQQRDYVVVVDSSQSMVGERYQRATALVERIAQEMDRRDRVMAIACDLRCRGMERPELPNVASAAALREFLEKQEPAGSSDMARSLRDALQLARDAGAGNDRALRLVYVGDGIGTMGHRQAGSIAAEVDAILSDDSVSLTTVGIGQDADSQTLEAIARAGGGHYVPFTPGQRTGAAALAVLETAYGPSLQGAEIRLPDGVAAVAPAELPTVRAGQELLVAARMERDQVAGEILLTGKVGGRAFEQRYPVELTASRAAGNAFVPRMWASQTIEALELEGKSENRDRIVALSKAYGVMSRETSLLVLESEAMFRAFGVDRARPTLQWTGEDEAEAGEADGLLAQLGSSGLGLTGTGRGGGGVGTGALGLSGGAPSPAPSRASVSSRAPRVAAVDDLLDSARGGPSLAEEQSEAEAAPPRRQARGRSLRTRRPMPRGGQWMRKVWFREGRVRRGDEVRERDLAAVRAAEEALRSSPDSRDRHRAAVRALSRAGRLARAEEVARAWLERDRLDPEALTYLGDVVGRQGKREEALRLLSGIVDLQPENETLQERMANAFERAGEAELACAHRVTLAELESDDEDVVAGAMRCASSLGRTVSADRLAQLVDEDERDDVRARAARPDSPSRLRGDVLLDATWTGGSDVDLTLVTPQGTRLSWMGGRTTVIGDDASRIGRERVGLRRATPGTYYVEVNRADPNDTSRVRGEIRVRAFGETERIPFELEGVRAQVGQVSVVRRWRMENAPSR